jgi:hypothetical protein
MATTYTLISSVTVGSGGAATMSFSSIPATYTDICIKVSARTDNASILSNLRWTFNGSSSGYSGKELYGTGSAAASGDGGTTSSYIQAGYSNGATSTSNTFSNTEFYLPNYASANYKSQSIDSVQEDNASLAFVDMSATLWSNTSAVTSVTITPSSGSFVQYTTAYLYGISNA